MNILFTCAGRRNYLVNYFKEALKGNGKVIAADMQLTAPALIDADLAVQVSSIYDPNYTNEILEIVSKHNIKAIISLNDLELPILSKAKDKFIKLGSKLIVSDESVIDICFDKWKTFNFFIKNNIPTPLTYVSYNEALKALNKNEIHFPLIVKPRWGSASIGIDIVEDSKELEMAYNLQLIRIKRTILANASNEDINQSILIQEKINGIEFGMDIVNDFGTNYVGTFVRQKLSMRSGETDKAISIIDSKFEIVGEKISKKLKHIGNLDCDVFNSNGKLYVLELNPRFGGGYPFSHESGVNTAAMYVSWLQGIEDVNKYINYKEGVMFSKCDRLLKIN